MGVEYEHWFFVRDTSWVGTLQTAKAVDEVLHDWALAKASPAVRSAEGFRGRKTKPLPKLQAMAAPTLVVEYPGFVDDPLLTRVMGPSYYEPDGSIAERYLERITLVVGSDVQVFDGGECAYTEVTDTAGAEEYSASRRNLRLPTSRCFAASPHLPQVAFEAEDLIPMPEAFSGLWRAGLGLDCGADLPAFIRGGEGIPCQDFTDALEAAFGTQLVQIGFTY